MPENLEASAGREEGVSGFLESMKTLEKLKKLEGGIRLSKAVENVQRITMDKDHPLFSLPPGSGDDIVILGNTIFEKLDAMNIESSAFLENKDKSSTKERLEEITKLVEELNEQIIELEVSATEISARNLQEILDSKDPRIIQARTEFMEHIGLRGGEDSFQQIMEVFAKKLPAPDVEDLKDKNRKPEEIAALQNVYRTISKNQYVTLSEFINVSIMNISHAKRWPHLEMRFAFNDEKRRDAITSMVTFMRQREYYEAAIEQRVPDYSYIDSIVLPFGIEIAEEFGEHIWKFGDESKLLNAAVKPLSWTAGKLFVPPAYMDKIDPFLRQDILRGFKGLSAKFGPRAPKMLKTICNHVNRSSMGTEFWRKLFSVESPFTICLFVYYVNVSNNRQQAAMRFASYLSVSAYAGQVMKHVIRRRLLMYARSVGRAAWIRTYLRGAAKLPKNIVAQFMWAFAACIGMSGPIDSAVRYIDEEVWDDDPNKELGLMGLDMLFMNGLVQEWQFALEDNIPGWTLDPETDGEDYLGRESLTIRFGRHGGWWPSFGYEMLNDPQAWIEQMRKAIREEKDPVKKKLYQNELDTFNGRWNELQAFRFFGKVQNAGRMEQNLETELIKRGVIENKNSLDLLYYATDDEWKGFFEKDISQRPDTAIKFMEDNEKFPVGRIRAYIKKLEEEISAYDTLEKRKTIVSTLSGTSKETIDEELKMMDAKLKRNKKLVQQWKDYRRATDEIAKLNVMFSHLEMYDKEQWLGDVEATEIRNPKITDLVIEGMVAEINYHNEREKIFSEGLGARVLIERMVEPYVGPLKDPYVHKHVFSPLYDIIGMYKSLDDIDAQRQFRWALEDTLPQFVDKNTKKIFPYDFQEVTKVMRKYMKKIAMQDLHADIKEMDRLRPAKPFSLSQLDAMGGVNEDGSGTFSTMQFSDNYMEYTEELRVYMVHGLRGLTVNDVEEIASVAGTWAKDRGDGKGSLLSQYEQFTRNSTFYNRYFTYRGLNKNNLIRYNPVVEAIKEARAHKHNAAVIVKNYSEEERIYRSGMEIGRITEIADDRWGVRLDKKFYHMQWNKEKGEMEVRVIDVSDLEGALGEVERMLRFAEDLGAQTDKSGTYVRKFTEGEKQTAKLIKQRIDEAEWVSWNSLPSSVRLSVRYRNGKEKPESYAVTEMPKLPEYNPNNFQTMEQVQQEFHLPVFLNPVDPESLAGKLRAIYRDHPGAETKLAQAMAKRLANSEAPESYRDAMHQMYLASEGVPGGEKIRLLLHEFGG